MYAWGSRLHILTHGKRCAGVLKLCQHIFTIGENDLLQANSRSCTFVGHVTAARAKEIRLFLHIVQIYFMLNNLYKQRSILQLVFLDILYRRPQKRRFAMQCLIRSLLSLPLHTLIRDSRSEPCH